MDVSLSLRRDSLCLAEVSRSVRKVPLGIAEASPGVRKDPLGMAEVSPGFREDPLGMAEVSRSVRKVPLGIAEVSPGFREDPLGIAELCLGIPRHSPCMAEVSPRPGDGSPRTAEGSLRQRGDCPVSGPDSPCTGELPRRWGRLRTGAMKVPRARQVLRCALAGSPEKSTATWVYLVSRLEMRRGDREIAPVAREGVFRAIGGQPVHLA